MLFTLADASPDISKVMRAWLAKQHRLRPVFNLFFGMRYHPDMYLDVRFLMYAQAIETYGFLRRKTRVRRSFADNVTDVLVRCKTVSRRIVGRDQAGFISHLTVSRNYYTHYDPKKQSRAATGVTLHGLTVQLEALIEMALLHELGFSQGAIDTILERVGRYRQVDHFKALAVGETDAATEPHAS
jgi:hypothetical protein